MDKFSKQKTRARVEAVIALGCKSGRSVPSSENGVSPRAMQHQALDIQEDNSPHSTV
jgi:hypothetical protein